MLEPSHRVYHTLFPLVIILALGAFLLLFHLDHRPFWQDEAETAGLAKNVLQYGVPRAYDGINIISQEQGRELDQNFLWRWSPWLQIYIAAAAFRLGGLSTFTGRLPFAIMGLACIFLVYYVVKRNFGNYAWALISAALLSFSVPFLLYARQCRYYSLGALLTMLSLYAFEEDWESNFVPALLLCLSAGLLFHTNYLLFFTFVVPAFFAAFLLYPHKMPLKRTALVILTTFIIILPGLFLFRIQAQSKIVNLAVIPKNLEQYFGGLFQYLVPLPIVLYLLWRWYLVYFSRSAIPEEPGDRFILFLSLIIFGNILCLSPAPQCEHRYLMHLYPLCAIILGWVILRAWRYYKLSAVLLALLLLFTNWLYIVPMDWLTITNRPSLNDRHMLTSPNLPLQLFLTELISGYPDVNRNFIKFFQTHAHAGDTILTTYGDLPLQFYTPYRVIGGLQGPIASSRPPEWVVPRWVNRWNRSYHLNASEIFIKEKLNLASDYYPIVLPFADEEFGNIADPYSHRFIPEVQPLAEIVIYRKKAPSLTHVR
jgi:4-amino-4-deoxy-L-arabinose transferase-like glycosyltransferase